MGVGLSERRCPGRPRGAGGAAAAPPGCTNSGSKLWLNHYDYLRSQGCLQGLSGRLLLFSTVFNTLIDQVTIFAAGYNVKVTLRT